MTERTVTMSVPRRQTSFRGITVGQALIWFILIGGGIVMLMPFFWLVSSSLKQPQNIYVFPPQWIPDPIHWDNYREVFRVAPVLLYARNTLLITGASTLGQVITASISAYGFARLRFRGRDLVFSLVLATMMLPFAVTMIPLYIMFTQIGWIGTFLPLIVPSWFGGGAFSIFLMRQFFRTIPMELEEAALIDGAGRMRILARIILPLSRPALVTVTILSFLGHWNAFMQPLIYLKDRRMWTLALGVSALGEFESGRDYTHYMMVLSTIMVVPVIVLYFVAQRAFIQGIVFTGLKG